MDATIEHDLPEDEGIYWPANDLRMACLQHAFRLAETQGNGFKADEIVTAAKAFEAYLRG